MTRCDGSECAKIDIHKPCTIPNTNRTYKKRTNETGCACEVFFGQISEELEVGDEAGKLKLSPILPFASRANSCFIQGFLAEPRI